MKRHIIVALTVGLTLGAYAFTPPTPLTGVPAGAHHPVLSPDGSRLLFSTDVHTGLKAMDMATGTITTIDDAAAAGFAPVFSTDGSKVVYRTAELIDGLVYRDVRSYDFATRQGRRLAGATRAEVDINAEVRSAYAYSNHATIRVNLGGTAADIAPLADAHSYLWASLSPDGSHLLFCEPFSGVYVANADGTDARRIMRPGDYPCWAGNGTIVAAVSHDDGYQVTDSKLVAVDLATLAVTDLTDERQVVSEVTAAADGSAVVFADIEGNMFIIKK